MKNMVDIITKIIGKQEIKAISPADIGIVMAGGLAGFTINNLTRGISQIPTGMADIIGLILTSAGALYLKQPWNTLSAGLATGITVGALRLQTENVARRFVASTMVVPVDAKTRKMTPDTHIGATNGQDRTPNSPYVGMIQPNVVYMSGAAGYSQGMANSGLSNSSSIKAPMGNGARYTM